MVRFLSRPCRSAFALGAAIALAQIAPAQATAQGYSATFQSLPGSANSIAVVEDGVAWFDGFSLQYDEPGQPTRALLTFPAFRFGSFTLPIGNGDLLFAESSNGQLWRVPIDPLRTPQLLTSIQFAYDAVMIGTGVAVVSAKTGGFSSAQNDLLAVDLVTGAQSTVGMLPGASGPLALTPERELVYATAPLTFPPPPQSVEIVRWNAAQWSLALNGGLVLTRTNAQLVLGGIDSAGDLAVDADDDLFLADYGNARVLEISDHHTTKGLSTIVDYTLATTSPAVLTFLPGSARDAEFEPFAHSGAGTLCIVETDYFTTTRAVRLSTAPAPLSLLGGGHGPVAPGAFTLVQQGSPQHGVCLFAIGSVGTGTLLPLRLPGFEQTLLWEAGLLYPIVTSLTGADAMGASSLTLQNPGFPGGLWIHCQTAFLTADGSTIGASNVQSVSLQ